MSHVIHMTLIHMTLIWVSHTLLQNIVSFVGFFCKRDMILRSLIIVCDRIDRGARSTLAVRMYESSLCECMRHVPSHTYECLTLCVDVWVMPQRRSTLSVWMYAHEWVVSRTSQSHEWVKSVFCNVREGLIQCVAGCCSVLQCVVKCCSVLQCVAACCSVLRCVAVLWNMLQRHVTNESSRRFAMFERDFSSVLQCVAMRCDVLWNVVVRCSVWQCVAMRCDV